MAPGGPTEACSKAGTFLKVVLCTGPLHPIDADLEPEFSETSSLALPAMLYEHFFVLLLQCICSVPRAGCPVLMLAILTGRSNMLENVAALVL